MRTLLRSVAISFAFLGSLRAESQPSPQPDSGITTYWAQRVGSFPAAYRDMMLVWPTNSPTPTHQSITNGQSIPFTAGPQQITFLFGLQTSHPDDQPFCLFVRVIEEGPTLNRLLADIALSRYGIQDAKVSRQHFAMYHAPSSEGGSHHILEGNQIHQWHIELKDGTRSDLDRFLDPFQQMNWGDSNPNFPLATYQVQKAFLLGVMAVSNSGDPDNKIPGKGSWIPLKLNFDATYSVMHVEVFELTKVGLGLESDFDLKRQ